MRSVLIHFKNAIVGDITAFLTETYPFQEGPPWICAVNGDACLYIDLYEHLDIEFEPGRIDILIQKLGATPTVSIIADVSGRHAGDEQAKDFAVTLLTRFEGLAGDDYSEHFWTLEEILAGHAVEDSQRIEFFDYVGDYQSHPPTRE